MSAQALRVRCGLVHERTGTLWSLAFLDNGRTLASAGEDRTVRLWTVTTGTERTLVQQPNKFACVSAWQDRALAFGGWDDYTVQLWDLQARTPPLTLRGHLGPVKSLAVMPTGGELVTGSWDGTIRLWNRKPGGQSEILTRHTDIVYAVTVSPDEATLAFAGMAGVVKLLDLKTRQERATLIGHTGPVLSLAFSNDGKLLVSASTDQTVRLWRAATDDEMNFGDWASVESR